MCCFANKDLAAKRTVDTHTCKMKVNEQDNTEQEDIVDYFNYNYTYTYTHTHTTHTPGIELEQIRPQGLFWFGPKLV